MAFGLLLLLGWASGVLQAQEDPWWDSLKGSEGLSVGSLKPRFSGTGASSGSAPSETTGIDQGDVQGSSSEPENQGEAARLDPTSADIAATIREWISLAEPPENVTDGADFHYDKWGRKIGKTGDGGIITTTGKPDYALSTPEETVWSMREVLDSVDHCTLEEYVLAKLQHHSIENCRGRYQAPETVIVTKLSGLPFAEAKKRLDEIGLIPRLVAGRPAPGRDSEGIVATQEPGAGTKLKPGQQVKLEVYGPYNPKITVSDVAGLRVEDAKKTLAAQGLKARLVALGPAPSNELSFTVKESEPAGGAEVKPGTEITLKIYDKYRPTTPESPPKEVLGLVFPPYGGSLSGYLQGDKILLGAPGHWSGYLVWKGDRYERYDASGTLISILKKTWAKPWDFGNYAIGGEVQAVSEGNIHGGWYAVIVDEEYLQNRLKIQRERQ